MLVLSVIVETILGVVCSFRVDVFAMSHKRLPDGHYHMGRCTIEGVGVRKNVSSGIEMYKALSPLSYAGVFS